MKRAIFLDRDGIINEDKSYVCKIDDFEFKDGIIDVLKHLQNLGYILIIITNQSGIGRGLYTKDDFEKLTTWMREELKRKNIDICAVYYCPHAPGENCDCRKPNPKMLEIAIEQFDINTKNSWMIGDKQSDIEAGINAGILNTIFVNSSTCSKAKYNAKKILDIITIIKK